jgi:hypothetical protein
MAGIPPELGPDQRAPTSAVRRHSAFRRISSFRSPATLASEQIIVNNLVYDLLDDR